MNTSQADITGAGPACGARERQDDRATPKCKLCGCDIGVTHQAREMMLGMRDRFEYFECGACGCLQLINAPKDMTRYYPPYYYSLTDLIVPRDFYQSKIRRWLGRQKNAGTVFGGQGISRAIGRLRPRQDLLSVRQMFAPTCVRSFHARILDVGCGNGGLLTDLAVAGFENLVGVDPYTTERRDLGPRLTILTKHVEKFEAEPFDLIMCHHTLEHMPDQVGAMRSFHRLLKNGGTCLIRIPIASSEVWRKYQRDWVELDAPRHLFLHSRQSFESLARQNGFELSHVRYDTTGFAYWGSELYRRNIPLCEADTHAIRKPEEFFTAAELSAFDRAAELANERKDGGRAAFYLRKE